MSHKDFLRRNVSRETFECLLIYESLIQKWNPRINLVSKSTLQDLWGRHFLDSAQLLKYCPKDAKKWLDIGSGAGFPGMLIAILAQETYPDLRITLIESDQRKAAFLRVVQRETHVKTTIICNRIEACLPQQADILSARALAPLEVLLEYVTLHRKRKGLALFPKGKNHTEEIKRAFDKWQFDLQKTPSEIEKDSVILIVGEIIHDSSGKT